MDEATYDPGHVGRSFFFVKINGRGSVGGDDGSFEGENDGYSVVIIEDNQLVEAQVSRD